MLAIPHFSYQANYMANAHNAFLPPIPSPLSPRSANVFSRSRNIFMDQPSRQENTPGDSKDTGNEGSFVPFSKRAVKKAPSPKQDELKERRRKQFLKKVAHERDDKRFEARGEDMMRLDFYQRQRQWEAEQALAAPTLPFETTEEEEIEEDGELPVSSWTGSAMQVSAPSTQYARASQPEDEVDDVLQRENEELEALLECMPENNGDVGSDHFYSDDEDYDALFSELLERDAMGTGQQQAELVVDQDEAMDTS